MTKETDRLPTRPVSLARTVKRSWVVWILATYAALLLVIAATSAFWLYGWARDRIIQSAPWTTAHATLSPSNNPAPPAAQQGANSGNNLSNTASEQAAGAEDALRQPINVLLMGTDARPEENAPPRTDTLILLTLDRQTQTAGMLSLPRDLWVPIPGVDVTTKINTAYSLGEQKKYPGGGAQLTKDTVSSFIGQPVQYYVRVNFHGFVELVDLIGGVDINVRKTIHDEEYPTAGYGVETFHLEAGLQHLDGETALKYARTRHVDDDYGRSRRQQDLLRALFEQVTRTDMIPTLLGKAPQLMYTMRSSIDTDIPMATQLELANYFHQASLKEIRQLVLDSQYGHETYSSDGAWILLPDRARVREALEQFFQAPTAVQQASGPLISTAP
jgi:LCP family protein required for cell wall assembly